MTTKNFSSNKKLIILSIITFILIVGGIFAAVTLSNGASVSVSASDMLKLADRYLSELNYEQAIVEFQKVLTIDPKNVEAYLGVAEAYIELGDIDSAVEVLKEGLEVTEDLRLQNKLDELTKPVEIEVTEEIVQAEKTTAEAVDEPVATVTIAGTEIDIATTTSLVIYNKKLYEQGNWSYPTLDNPENEYDAVIYLQDDLTNEEFSKVKQLVNLQGLHIYYVGISDLSSLSELSHLTALYIRNTNISDITPLSSITGLTNLHLWYDQVTDITPISNLTNLVNLHLWGNQITDISPISNLTNLTYLSLRQNNITDITPILNLSKLTTLYLFDVPLSYTDLENLQSHLPSCQIYY